MEDRGDGEGEEGKWEVEEEVKQFEVWGVIAQINSCLKCSEL